MKNKKENLGSILKMQNITETSADLYFYGDIVSSWWGAWEDSDQYPEKVKNFLDEAKGKDLNIYVNSGGGAVFAGMAIYNMLKRHDGYKKVYVDGLAASIASIISLAGDEIIIPSNAYFMIHKPWTGVRGNATEIRKAADMLDTLETGALNVYEENLREGVSIETIKDMLEEETWLTGEQASEYFNVKVSDGVEAVACVSDMYTEYKQTPKLLAKSIANEDKTKKYLFDF